MRKKLYSTVTILLLLLTISTQGQAYETLEDILKSKENGFTIQGTSKGGLFGSFFASNGDINGDGYNDFVIGAPRIDGTENGNIGQICVFYGAEKYDPLLTTNQVDGTNGFSIYGVDEDDLMGTCDISGDVNGDGINDLILGASLANVEGNENAGKCYVIFGQNGEFPETFDLDSLNGQNGFAIYGNESHANLGSAAMNIGDINNDGIDDMAFGAPYASDGEILSAGKCFIVFGKSDGFPSEVNIYSLDGSNGFVIKGAVQSMWVGKSGIKKAGDVTVRNGIKKAGDINGDGIADIILPGRYFSDYKFVIFGSESFPKQVKLSTNNIDGTAGTILVHTNYGYSNSSLMQVDDLNNDGLMDIILSPESFIKSQNPREAVTIIFGAPDLPNYIDADDASFASGITKLILDNITSISIPTIEVNTVSDINGDGINDLQIIPNTLENGFSNSYIYYGQEAFVDSVLLDTLQQNGGLLILNPKLGDWGYDLLGSGSAGDLNHDGFNDFYYLIDDSLFVPHSLALHIIYGSSNLTSNQDIETLSNNNGRKILLGEFGSWNIHANSDINNDGFDDLVLTNSDHTIDEVWFSGITYIIHGGPFSLKNVKIVEGQLYLDTVGCAMDSSNSGLSNRIIRFSGKNTSYTMTNSLGGYTLLADSGKYQVTPVMPEFIEPYWKIPSCFPDSIHVLADSNTLNIPMTPKILCPVLWVDISTSRLVRCFDNRYYITYSNYGTVDAENAYIDITFDPYLEVLSANIPIADQLPNNTYRFNLGTIKVNTSGEFWITVEVGCDEEGVTLGQTHCVEAHIYPDSTCLPDDESWDGSYLEVDATCEADLNQVILSVTNTGGNGMTSPVNLKILENITIIKDDSVLLESKGTQTFSYPANGNTYTLMVDQTVGFLGYSDPIASIEGCLGNEYESVELGQVNIFSFDDAAPNIAVECRENRGSYDPNDKRVFPKGSSEAGYITADTDPEYHIRFQNTGTDTAFKVVIRDTLSAHLDITTLIPGVSSHDYELDIDSTNILVFTFNHILLPDSNTDEPNSHGFVKFKINQQPNNPPGTIIENQAAIYFDFNVPVITNQTTNTIALFEDIFAKYVCTPSTSKLKEKACVSYTSPSGKYEWSKSGKYRDTLSTSYGCDSIIQVDLTVIPVNTEINVTHNRLTADESDATNYSWLECTDHIQPVGHYAQTFIPEQSGNYSVVVYYDGCKDTSSCVQYEMPIVLGGSNSVNSSITVSPNPINGNTHLQFRHVFNVYKIEAFDMFGRKIELEMSEKDEVIMVKIDEGPGIYFVLLSFQNGEVQYVKVIKE